LEDFGDALLKTWFSDFIGVDNDIGLTISAQAIDNIQEAEWFLSIPKIVRPNIEGLSDKRIFLSEETLGRLVSREAVVWNEGALYRGLTSTLNEIDALNNVSGLAAKSVAELFSKNGTLFNQAAGISYGFESTLFTGGRNLRVNWGSFYLSFLSLEVHRCLF